MKCVGDSPAFCIGLSNAIQSKTTTVLGKDCIKVWEQKTNKMLYFIQRRLTMKQK